MTRIGADAIVMGKMSAEVDISVTFDKLDPTPWTKTPSSSLSAFTVAHRIAYACKVFTMPSQGVGYAPSRRQIHLKIPPKDWYRHRRHTKLLFSSFPRYHSALPPITVLGCPPDLKGAFWFPRSEGLAPTSLASYHSSISHTPLSRAPVLLFLYAANMARDQNIDNLRNHHTQ